VPATHSRHIRAGGPPIGGRGPPARGGKLEDSLFGSGRQDFRFRDLCQIRAVAWQGGSTMIKISVKANKLAIAAVCSTLSTLFPTESFADLNDIACRAINRGCIDKCGLLGGKEECYDKCDYDYVTCSNSGLTKQQTPPQPCRGIHCSLRNPHPPTTVGPPTRRPPPVKPVKPVGVSNPNKTTNAPVILLRKNDSGGGQGRRH